MSSALSFSDCQPTISSRRDFGVGEGAAEQVELLVLRKAGREFVDEPLHTDVGDRGAIGLDQVVAEHALSGEALLVVLAGAGGGEPGGRGR